MPIYEYHCTHCNSTFEEWLKVSEADSAQKCPTCGVDAQRLVSHTSFVLKGSGWYVTEYGKNSASSSCSSSNTASSAAPSAVAPTEKSEKPNEASAKEVKKEASTTKTMEKEAKAPLKNSDTTTSSTHQAST